MKSTRFVPKRMSPAATRSFPTAAIAPAGTWFATPTTPSLCNKMWQFGSGTAILGCALRVRLFQGSFRTDINAAIRQAESHSPRNRRHVRAGSCRRSHVLPLTGYGRSQVPNPQRIQRNSAHEPANRSLQGRISGCLVSSFFATSRGGASAETRSPTNGAEQCSPTPSTRSFSTLDLPGFRL
jgi:hypothetical protein